MDDKLILKNHLKEARGESSLKPILQRWWVSRNTISPIETGSV